MYFAHEPCYFREKSHAYDRQPPPEPDEDDASSKLQTPLDHALHTSGSNADRGVVVYEYSRSPLFSAPPSHYHLSSAQEELGTVQGEGMVHRMATGYDH